MLTIIIAAALAAVAPTQAPAAPATDHSGHAGHHQGTKHGEHAMDCCKDGANADCCKDKKADCCKDGKGDCCAKAGKAAGADQSGDGHEH